MPHITRRVRSFAAIVAIHVAAAFAAGEIKLNTLFGDGMVLQRDVAAPIWGTATPGATLEVRVAGKAVATATVRDGGRFHFSLPAMPAPGPYEIELRGDGPPVMLRDVLAGDVWLCSGQSNMQWTLLDSENGAKAVADASLPTVRLYYVPRIASGEPRAETTARWRPCTPETSANFSAVAYFFGRKLNRDLNVPIGLIHSSWGGTPAESWTPLATLRTLGDLPLAQTLVTRGDAESTQAALDEFVAKMRQWMAATGHTDRGIDAIAQQWADGDFDDAAWKTMRVPTDAIKAGVGSGSTFWLRKTFDVPADLAGRPFTLDLSIVDDFDQTFVNGMPVGATGVETPTWTSWPRVYAVPGRLVRAGKNVVAIRVHDLEGRAGLIGNANQIRATFDAASGAVPTVVDLSGEWRYAVEHAGPTTGPALRPARPAALLRPDNPQFPGSLYDGMIAPLGDVGLKGVIWYQGESNAPRAKEYAPLMTALIGTWREQFKKPELPFYIVGLANYMAAVDDPNAPSNWGALRQAQREIARAVPHTATTVTIDVGSATTIHPLDKVSVGERLALVALADTYGKTFVSRGPTLKSATRDGGRVTLTFDDVGAGLVIHGEKPASFSVAGTDGKFAWADATIVGDTVVVSTASVAEPQVVRYAYADNPAATLFNEEGLPAEPFEETVK